uniref:NADH dehydrogenase subunit 6 n=1 Tax=Setodes brevicaudatus TaxID=1876047 RepID=UPI0022DCDA57|nr:NADH dehydrogenase subunit 6 [Setodes brevicaudatus]UZZ44387.1 NADH dehydrogenase subunit 6 [Setodes brevicaudatus]
MINFFLLLFTFNNLMLLFTTYPMSILILLMIQVITLNIMMGILNKTFWFSYILFIITISGLLIMFIYLTSLTSNYINLINFKKWLILFIFIFLTSLAIYKMINSSMYYNLSLNFMDMNNKMNNLSLMKFYNNQLMIISFLLMNYLFFTMIIINKIINLMKGPLRSFN